MTSLRALTLLVRSLAASVWVLPLLAHAAPTWQINPSGTGASGATPVSFVDVGGAGFVQAQLTGPGTFQFVERGAYQVLQPDQATPFGARDLTVTYSVMGTGSLFDPTALRFVAGTIELFSDATFDFATDAGAYGADNGIRVARFDVFDGNVSPSNGLVTLAARLATGSLASGYLFDAGGNDLAAHHGVTLTLGIFNERVASPGDTLVSEIACGMSSYGGPGCNGLPYIDTPFAYAVRDGGFATISAVPEPGSVGMLLAGLGLLAAVAGRKRP